MRKLLFAATGRWNVSRVIPRLVTGFKQTVGFYSVWEFVACWLQLWSPNVVARVPFPEGYNLWLSCCHEIGFTSGYHWRLIFENRKWGGSLPFWNINIHNNTHATISTINPCYLQDRLSKGLFIWRRAGPVRRASSPR